MGMSGCNKMPLKKGKSNNLIEYKFNALKFDSTSYNSEVFSCFFRNILMFLVFLCFLSKKKKFFIVVALYKKCDKKAEYQILKCKSSPPVYVDSRKTASEPNSKVLVFKILLILLNFLNYIFYFFQRTQIFF